MSGNGTRWPRDPITFFLCLEKASTPQSSLISLPIYVGMDLKMMYIDWLENSRQIIEANKPMYCTIVYNGLLGN